ncbi:MAG: LapA family protein [Thermodesulfobacteriota bacterium]|nr:LapA family protein [Thermodesulfobacteriota bacterium]
MRNFFNTIFFALLVLFFVTFALSNSQTISLNFFGTYLRPIPVSLLILVPFLVGIILGSFLDIVERFSMRREVKKLRKELKEREIKSHEVATREV